MENKITLQYGDIIEINSPSNDDLHNKVFFINFINNKKIIIINNEDTKELLISEEGKILEESIDDIFLLHRQENNSYIAQNNITVNTYLSIYFGGKFPTIINGIVTNIEEDMIELTIIPTKEIIYIDFAYSGIPENLNIEKIIINSKNELLDDDKILNEEDDIEVENSYLKDKDTSLDEDLIIYKNETKMNEILLDEIEIEDTYEEFYHNVNVPENEKRYTLETQLNDYMNIVLNKYPPEERTEFIINLINMELNRYKELREKFSYFDDENNPHIPDKKGDFYKPLKNILHKLNKKLYWILPVFTGVKNIILEDKDNNINDNKYIYIIKQDILIKNIIDIMEKWKKNTSKDTINTYKKFINDLLKQFDNININSNDFDETNLENNVKTVNTNIMAINDTNDDIYNNLYSYVYNNSEIEKQKFIFETFNIGQNMLDTYYINNKINYKQKNLTYNDNINILSFVTLPYPVYYFSKINMDYTNIYDRSNINNKFVSYFQLLNNKTDINRYIISNLQNNYIDTDKNIHNDTLLNGINNFSIDDTIELNYKEKYELLLESFIPTTNKLLTYLNKFEKYHNISQILDNIQSFNIDIDTFTNKDYTYINKILNSNINNYFKELKENNNNLKILLKELNQNLDFQDIKYTFNILSKDLKTDILEYYKINEEIFTCNNEFINHLYKLDNGMFFMNCLNKHIIDLIVSNLLDTFIKKKSSTNKKELEDKCEKYFLSKKYSSIELLEDDNNKVIFFDSIYDNTLYSFANEYQNERDNMGKKQFIEFLTGKIADKLNINIDKAKREAYAIVEEKREVIDGDYAILVDKDTNKNYIYIRYNNTWKLDNKFNDFYVDNNKILCDINKDCISINDKCISNNKYDKQNTNEHIDKILQNFEKEYNLSIENIKGKLNENYEFSKKYLKNILDIKDIKAEYYNNVFLTLENNMEISVQISPFEKLKNRILKITDFSLRYFYIKKFCLKFTRESIDNENSYWLYCIRTGFKLIPKFLFRLSNIYTDSLEYIKELDTICSEQGTISDDNNYWVDKYSGYIIKRIEFSTDEGYDEKGFKLNTKEILEKEYTYNPNPNINDIDDLSKIIFNVLKSITTLIGINISEMNEFILKGVKNILNTGLPSKKEYEKLLAKNIKKDIKKTIPSYEESYNQLLILSILSYLLVAIQLHIPDIKTYKTFPGCIKSFKGYPVYDKEDKTSLLYISCVANKIKSSIEPWNTLLKSSETNIAKKMEAIIDKYIISDTKFIELKDKKNEYKQLNNNNDNDSLQFLALEKWHNFMPSLIDLHITNEDVQPLTDDFIMDVYNLVKKKYGIIDIFKSKNIFLTNKIIESIQKIVKKNSPLLQTSNGEPFLENSCCNSNINTIDYFISNDKNILEYNTLIQNYSTYIYKLNHFNKPKIIFHHKNTKPPINTLSNDFNENIIYKTFIYYCNFTNDIPIDNELKNICYDKPNIKNYNNLQEYITILKSNGKVYDKNTFITLLDIINKRNIKTLHSNYEIYNNIELLRIIIDNYIQTNSENSENNIDEIFIQNMYELLDNYSIEKNNNDTYIDKIINHLSDVNIQLKSKILQFIKKSNNITKKQLNDIEKLFDFEINVENLNFFKTYINNFLYIFPNIILHKNVNYDNIPKHWKLSEIHNEDIHNIIQNYYSLLMDINDIEGADIIFKIIKDKCSIFTKLLQYIYYIKPITIENKTIKSIFDKELIEYLFKYIFYNIFNEYINIQTNKMFLLETSTLNDYNEDIMTSYIVNIIHNFLKIMNNHYNLINNNYKKIKEKISYAKEKEKDTFTEYFKKLSDEERQIQNLLKINKLEEWSVGLQKGLTKYVPDNYDMEKQKIIQQAIKEKQLNKMDNVTEMNAEIYKYDLENEELLQKEIDDEEYNMNNIIDDDDPPSDVDDYSYGEAMYYGED